LDALHLLGAWHLGARRVPMMSVSQQGWAWLKEINVFVEPSCILVRDTAYNLD
jgi:hypothetical protein